MARQSVHMSCSFQFRHGQWWALVKDYPIIVPGATKAEALSKADKATQMYIDATMRGFSPGTVIESQS